VNITYIAGHTGNAMSFGATSTAQVAENSALDTPELTIEAWIRPTSLPTIDGQRMGVVDNESQYGLFVYAGGILTCIATNTAAQTTGTVTTNTWQHVACTHDGNTTTVYVNGVAVGSASGGGPIGNNGLDGLAIAANNPSGSQLIGAIDELRLFSAARTAEQICDDAEATCGP
jgi:hypothetical protein